MDKALRIYAWFLLIVTALPAFARPQGLTPDEPRRDPIQNLIESRLPSINVYAMNRGGRGNFRVSSQTPNDAAVTASTSANTPTPDLRL